MNKSENINIPNVFNVKSFYYRHLELNWVAMKYKIFYYSNNKYNNNSFLIFNDAKRNYRQ